jgi:hypothetical protein
MGYGYRAKSITGFGMDLTLAFLLLALEWAMLPLPLMD